MFCLKRGFFVLFFWLRKDKQDICFVFEMRLVFFPPDFCIVWQALHSGVNVHAKTFTLASLREIRVGNLELCSPWVLNFEVRQLRTRTCCGWKSSCDLLRIANDVLCFRLRIRCVRFGCHSFHFLRLYVLTFVWLFVVVTAALQSHFFSSGLDPPCVMRVPPLTMACSCHLNQS